MESRTFLTVVVSILSFFLILLAYTKLIGPIPFQVNNINTNNTDLFQVQGSGIAAAAPDRALATLGVTSQADNVLDAQSNANEKIKRIIDALKKSGVEEKNIKTINYSINPDYNLNANQRITGYTVTQNLEVESDISKINQVIDQATAFGANLVGGITFSLNEEKQLELENTARKEAVEIAKKKARGLADSAGIKLGKIINVTESQAREPRPVFLEAKTDQIQPNEPTSITPGENEIEITVTLTYQTL